MDNLYIKKTITQNLYNDGLNESNLMFEKNTMLFDAIRNHTEYVKHTKHYPKDDLMDIELELDCVILTRDEYNYLMTHGK